MRQLHGRRRLRALTIGIGAAALTCATAAIPSFAQAATTTLYVAPNGSDGNAGTLSAPLKTIQQAVSLVSAGGTIAVRGGTYAPATNITISKTPTARSPRPAISSPATE